MIDCIEGIFNLHQLAAGREGCEGEGISVRHGGVSVGLETWFQLTVEAVQAEVGDVLEILLISGQAVRQSMWRWLRSSVLRCYHYAS